jgi:hypothetical protein
MSANPALLGSVDDCKEQRFFFLFSAVPRYLDLTSCRSSIHLGLASFLPASIRLGLLFKTHPVVYIYRRMCRYRETFRAELCSQEASSVTG